MAKNMNVDAEITALTENLTNLVDDFNMKVDVSKVTKEITRLEKSTAKTDPLDDTIIREITSEFNYIYDLVYSYVDEGSDDKAQKVVSGFLSPFIDWILGGVKYNTTFDFTLALPNMKEKIEIFKIESETEKKGLDLENDSIYKCSECGANASPVEKQNRSGDEAPAVLLVCSVNKLHKNVS